MRFLKLGIEDFRTTVLEIMMSKKYQPLVLAFFEQTDIETGKGNFRVMIPGHLDEKYIQEVSERIYKFLFSIFFEELAEKEKV